jgi:glycine/D-amino acid oxidase-like deaminating enzyme
MLGPDYDLLIVGGGFYGSVLALHAAKALGLRAALFERDRSLLARASYANQARVHGGYHYPRSILTGFRSQANFDRFLQDFRDCVDSDFQSIYAVSRSFSNVTASQFRRFSERIGAPIERAPIHIRKLFDPHMVEDVFRVREAVFDARKLASRLARDLSGAGVDVHLDTEALRIERLPGGILEVTSRQGAAIRSRTAGHVFDCTYSRINQTLVASGLSPIGLTHELAELALLRVPEPLERLGITVMCGPFFSLLPFPSLGLHSLSHVRYTPHRTWRDGEGEDYRDAYSLRDLLPKRSRHLEMMKDASRYLPLLSESTYLESVWEVKTVLPRNDVDDGRPILFMRDYGMPGLHCVMGSKIDNVYDMIDVASSILA